MLKKVTENLYVGTLDDLVEVDAIVDEGVEIILNVAHGNVAHGFWEKHQRPPAYVYHDRGVRYVWVPLYDSPDETYERWRLAVEICRHCIQDGKTLVMCHVGASRSISVAAGAIMEDGLTPEVAVMKCQRMPMRPGLWFMDFLNRLADESNDGR